MTFAVLLMLLLAQATPSPAPTPTPGPCFHDAQVVKPAYPVPTADVPSDGQPLYAAVSVLIGPDGKIEKATIYKSSGNLGFDTASIRAARQSVFKPKVVNCQPVEGTAFFLTSLTPGPPH
jgi:protein TonB